jgi:hypothetical protein
MISMPQPTPADFLRVEESVAATTQVEIVHCSPGIPDLAPLIVRQRLVIEGICPSPIVDDKITSYLSILSDVCGMRLLAEPVTHRSDRYGWAGWVHWESSGCHFYAWDSPTLFFSVDIYTCKHFDFENACKFTKIFFEAPQIVAMAF